MDHSVNGVGQLENYPKGKKGQRPYLRFHTKLNWKGKSKKLNYKILEKIIDD